MICIDVFDSATLARRRLEAERDAYRVVLRTISQCNDGKGYMPELAQRILAAYTQSPLSESK